MSVFDDELLRAVEVGSAVYHRKPTGELPPGELRRGGLVCAVVTDVDTETGEIQRAFVTATRWHGRIRFDRLTQDDVDPARLELVNAAHVRGLSRHMGTVYGQGRGVLTKDDIDLVETAATLARCVG